MDTSRSGLGEEGKVQLYPRVGAYLNGGPADGAVLRYLGALDERGEAESVHAIAAPEHEGIAGADLAERVAAEMRVAGGERLAARVRPEFHETGDAGAILRFIRERDLDLMVLGRRIPSHQLDHPELYPRLVGRSPCDVLVVTPFSPARLDRVLVPTDFSRHAGLALRAGARLVRALGSPAGEITCHHVFEVPYGYAYSGRSMKEFAEEQRGHAERAFADFLDGNDAGDVPVRCEYTPSHSVADAVVELALAIQADLVAVGSRGRTATAALLVGSIAVKVLEKCAAPVLIVKEKGETLNLLDALLPH